MKKNFCQQCQSRERCRRPCRIVNAELQAKGVRKTDKATGALKHSKKEIRVEPEADLTGPQQAAWNNRIYGAYDDGNEK
jgi:hypothetical protein